MRKFDKTSFFLALTIGYPFATFKILLGVLLLRNEFSIAYAALGWGIIDILMNSSRIFLSFFPEKEKCEFCILAQIGRFFGLQKVFLSIDTLMAFSIICYVLWSGWITHLKGWEMFFWLTATTINLLSVAIVQIWWEIKKSPVSKKQNNTNEN